VQALANGWYRVALTVATAVAGTNTIVIAGSTGDNVQDYDGTNGLTSIFAWGAQLEAGAFATSPIITTGAAGTRGADAASIVLLSNVSSFAATYNSGTTATGAVTPGATFDLVTARAWLNGYLQRFRVT
jgi:hypothetical protein